MMRLINTLSLLVMIVFLLISCASYPPGAQPATTIPDHPQVLVLPEHQRCEQDDDCVLFPMECSDCDCETILNRVYLEEYQVGKAAVCDGYHGKMCEIYCPVEPKCLQGKCTAAPLPTPAQ
jgi:hypothetical protein